MGPTFVIDYIITDLEVLMTYIQNNDKIAKIKQYLDNAAKNQQDNSIKQEEFKEINFSINPTIPNNPISSSLISESFMINPKTENEEKIKISLEEVTNRGISYIYAALKVSLSHYRNHVYLF